MSTNDQRKKTLPLNSIDFTVKVDRLPIKESYAKGVFLYGRDNLYPNKVRELGKRSGTLVRAISTLSKFVRGSGDERYNDIVINEDGKTFFDLIRFVSNEVSEFGFAIHVTYNKIGEAVDFTFVDFEDVRVANESKDGYKIYEINNDWGKSSGFVYNDSFVCYDFNPEKVLEQIQKDGFENYNGQLFYHNPSNKIYPLASYDAVIDDVQIEAEAKLTSLSNLQNGFMAGGVFKYPANIDSVKSIKSIEDKVMNTKGAINAGRIITVPLIPSMDKDLKMFEPFTLPNIDKLFPQQIAQAKANIYEHFQQPGVLNGHVESGMFNDDNLEQAYKFYNSVTAQERQDLEKQLNKLFSNSIHDISDIKIKELVYTDDVVTEQDEAAAEAARIEAQANLKGTVGGVQGILSIQLSVSQGVTEYNSGLEILKEIYGFSEEQAQRVLGAKK